jgi:hypothetical protein
VGDIATPALGLQVMLAHQPADLLVVDDDALMTKIGADASIAVSLELVADSLHVTNDLGVIDLRDRRVIESGA